VKYTTTSTGTTATFKAASDTIFFQSPKETVTFAAYSPYYEDLASDGDNKGIISLSADNAHNVTDYIWAKAEGATYTDNKVNFTFTHIQSKLKINVKLDESVSLPKEVTNTTTEPSVTIASVKIEGLVESGTFNTATGESTTVSDADATEILYNYDANTGVSVAEGYEYIIIPQTIAAKGFILTVTTSNGDIYKKTFDSKITFAPGYAYTYNITAKKYNLEVEATISKWSEKDEEDEDAMMTKKTIAQFEVFSDPDETQIYDLAFSDGTYMRIADADGNIPQSITIPSDKTVSGIVYSRVDATAQDNILKRDYASCNHGLILALSDAATECKWQSSKPDMGIYYIFQMASSSVYTPEYGYTIISYYDSNDYYLKTNTLGYNNTTVLRAFNKNNSNSDYYVTAVAKVDDYSAELKNTSGWYLPSPKELQLWDSDGCKLDNLQSLLTSLQANYISVSLFKDGNQYWSSTEDRVTGVFCYQVNSGDNLSGFVFCATPLTELLVRAICAF
jgi:hypothetical protein